MTRQAGSPRPPAPGPAPASPAAVKSRRRAQLTLGYVLLGIAILLVAMLVSFALSKGWLDESPPELSPPPNVATTPPVEEVDIDVTDLVEPQGKPRSPPVPVPPAAAPAQRFRPSRRAAPTRKRRAARSRRSQQQRKARDQRAAIAATDDVPGDNQRAKQPSKMQAPGVDEAPPTDPAVGTLPRRQPAVGALGQTEPAIGTVR